jgi:hypothetical protein
VNSFTSLLRSRHLKGRDFILLAWLLLAAQVFSQLHGVEHLDDAVQDQEACPLCILVSGLDAGSVVATGMSGIGLQASEPPAARRKVFVPVPAVFYQGRAPPFPSSNT